MKGIRHISDLAGQRVLIVGLGKTGLALARLLIQEGALVTINDQQPWEQHAAALAELEGSPYRADFGCHRVETFLAQDLILVSPGVPLNQAAFQAARQKGIPLLNDLELAYSLTKAPFLAVAGTNGKTTATTLLGEIYKKAGKSIVFGGNIGIPLTPLVCSQPDCEFVIAEVSSFQLEVIHEFRPWIGIMLNITPDHLDRYASWSDYVETKARLFINQKKTDYAMVNAHDQATEELLAKRAGAGRLVFFQTKDQGREGVLVQDNQVVARLAGREEIICSLSNWKLPGEHNLENLLPIIWSAWLSGIDGQVIQKSLEGFHGLSHRIEFVAEIGGVRFIDDSKGTNVDAVIRAIQSIKEPIWLILGGRDKGNDYSPLLQVMTGRVKGVLAIGESRKKVEDFFHGKFPVFGADSMKEAIETGLAQAVAGDTVLLSPACASFDMFDSYAHRGRVFQQIVREMKDGYGKNL